MRRILTAAGAAVLTLALAGGAQAADVKAPNPLVPIDDPIPGHIRNGAIQTELQTVAAGGGLTAPNWGTFMPGDPGGLYVVDQDGPLWRVDTATGATTMCLDTSALLVPLGAFGPGTSDERGFLGVAFHPTNGKLYTFTSEPIPGIDYSQIPATPGGTPNDSVVREWPGCGAAPAESRVVLSYPKPQYNHNGGAIFFGTRPDDRDLLYVTSGDGGCADDQNLQTGFQGETCDGHGPGSEAQEPNAAGNGQNPDTPLGKILRIDPAAHAGPAPTPADTFALGFRNPFRASSDRVDLGGTGAIWTADVGQNHLEEVDARIVQGGNYGWHVKEGDFLFNPFRYVLLNPPSDGFPFQRSPGFPAGLIDPVAEYDHDEGLATIGGFVYRGGAIPALRGHFVFGDFSDGTNSGNGRVMYVDEADSADPERRTPKVFNLINGHTNLFVLGFGEGADGELYVLANKTGIPFGDDGIVMKIVSECARGADCRD
jgi:glucose/arabinose dehydrogenase